MKIICFLLAGLILRIFSSNAVLAQQIDRQQLEGTWQSEKYSALLSFYGDSVHLKGTYSWKGIFDPHKNNFRLTYSPSENELRENDSLPKWVIDSIQGKVKWTMDLNLKFIGTDSLALDGQLIKPQIEWSVIEDSKIGKITDTKVWVSNSKTPIKVFYRKSYVKAKN